MCEALRELFEDELKEREKQGIGKMCIRDRELRDRKITVTAVCPGPVDTEFFDVAEQKGQTAYVKKLAMAKAPQVVAKALKDAACGKEMSVYGALMKGTHLAAKILPHRVLLSLMGIIF